MRSRLGVGGIALLVLAATRGAGAQDVANEVWPEIDIYFHPARHQRTFLEISTSTEREGTKREGTVGLYQDYLWLPRGFVRAGYRYTRSLRDDSYRESRGVLEGTVGGGPITKVRVLNRTRLELRWVNGGYSYRVRDRIQVQYGMQNTGMRLTPYGTVEAYWDSQYEAISRIGGRVGSEGRINGLLGWDLYLARQNNRRTTPKYVNALGIVAKLTFR